MRETIIKITNHLVLLLMIVCFYSAYNSNHELKTIKQSLTVKDVFNRATTEGVIVKDIDTWAVLDEFYYSDREVVEIAICCDTEDTLCLFIELDEFEKPMIKDWD